MHACLPRGSRTQGDEVNEATSADSRPPAVNTGLTGLATMTVFKLDPEVYKRYKDEVLKLCNSFQKIDQPGLSDKQIAERLGLDERTVTEIRCVAERDCYSLDEWEKAIEFKRRATLEWSALALKRPDLKPE